MTPVYVEVFNTLSFPYLPAEDTRTDDTDLKVLLEGPLFDETAWGSLAVDLRLRRGKLAPNTRWAGMLRYDVRDATLPSQNGHLRETVQSFPYFSSFGQTFM